MPYQPTAPDEETVEKMRDEAAVMKAESQNPFPSMTYVDGVEAALSWVTGEASDTPLEW